MVANNNTIGNESKLISHLKKNQGKPMWVKIIGEKELSYRTSDLRFDDDATVSFTDIKGNQISCHPSQISFIHLISDSELAYEKRRFD